jgi:Phosphodiester glycosidase
VHVGQMRHVRIIVAVVLAVVLVVMVTVAGCASTREATPPASIGANGVVLSGWTELFRGVRFQRGHTDQAFDLTKVQRPQDASILQIDLTAPGLRFATNPLGGPDSPPRPGHQVNTLGGTLGDFMARRPELSVAVNANFFWPCCQAGGGEPVGMTVIGLAIDAGAVVSDPSAPQRPAPGCEPVAQVPDANSTGSVALVIDTENHASIIAATANDRLPANLAVAVAGGPQPGGGSSGCGPVDEYPPRRHADAPNLLLENAKIQPAASERPSGGLAARTFVGVSADRRYLYLVAVDGGDNAGASFHDEAAWLQLLGATDGFNLDGGGSTAMAMNIAAALTVPGSPCPRVGSVQTLDVPLGFVDAQNQPVRCGLRLIGTYLGVIAPPTAPPTAPP